jgi:hypothetical protein
LLLPDAESDVMQVKDRVRTFRLNQYAPYKGSYRYLILVAATEFSDSQLDRMKEVSSRIPVEALIYENQAQGPPYRFFDNTLVSRSLHDAVKQFTGYFRMRLRAAVNLEPSGLERPGFFHLSRQMHPFLVWLLTGVVVGIIYGILFSLRSSRDFNRHVHSTQPAIAVFLLQALVSAAGGAFLVAAVVQPMVIATRVPAVGYLLAVCAIFIAVTVATGEAVAKGQRGENAILKQSALILFFLLSIYLLQPMLLAQIQYGAMEKLWLLMPPVIFLLTWFAWRIQQRVVFQIGEFYPVTVAWSWIVSALGVLGGALVSTQIWMRLGWSTVIIWAAVLYAVVLLIAGWVAVSSTVRRHGVIEADSTS